MISKKEKWAAFKEACADTGVGAAMNIPLNFIMLYFALEMEMNAWQITLFMTTVFTVVAIARKTYIRIHFANRYQKMGRKAP